MLASVVSANCSPRISRNCDNRTGERTGGSASLHTSFTSTRSPAIIWSILPRTGLKRSSSSPPAPTSTITTTARGRSWRSGSRTHAWNCTRCMRQRSKRSATGSGLALLERVIGRNPATGGDCRSRSGPRHRQACAVPISRDSHRRTDQRALGSTTSATRRGGASRSWWRWRRRSMCAWPSR